MPMQAGNAHAARRARHRACLRPPPARRCSRPPCLKVFVLCSSRCLPLDVLSTVPLCFDLTCVRAVPHERLVPSPVSYLAPCPSYLSSHFGSVQ